MRLVSYQTQDGWRAGVSFGDVVVDAVTAARQAGLEGEPGEWSSVRRLVARDAAELARLQEAAQGLAASDGLSRAALRLGPPVPDAEKILCIGLNYVAHQQESAASNVDIAQKLPEYPVVFNKFGTSLLGDGGEIDPPAATRKLDWEAELAVVIGREARNVALEDALEHVAGYANFNDVSARDLQLRSPQWAMGKGFDTSGPMGPELVLADEVPDPQALWLEARLNGEVMQRASTSDMIFSVAQLVEYISSAITLVPGDIIATGTPAGVGLARKPPVFMKAGDTIEVEIEGLGCLRNTVVAPSDPFVSRLEQLEEVQT